MPKVTLEGFIEVPDADLDLVQSELPFHIDLTRKEPGCLIFSVERDHRSSNRFNVYEVFVSEEAFEHHQARVKGSRWGLSLKTFNDTTVLGGVELPRGQVWCLSYKANHCDGFFVAALSPLQTPRVGGVRLDGSDCKNGFNIDEYELDNDKWTEGYFTE